MGDVLRIQVHKDLISVMEDLRKQISIELKQKYKLKSITVPRTLSSQILAAKIQGKRSIPIKLRKTSLTTGILEIK